MPWTIHEILAKSERKAYEDIRDDAAEMPDLVDLEEDRQEREVPRVRHTGPPGKAATRPSSAFRPHQERPRSRSPLPGRGADEALPEPRAKQARPDSVHLAFMSNELSMSPCEYWKNENAMVEVAIDLPHWSSPQRKQMMRDFSAFIVRQLKRQNTEVSERRMSEDEKTEFRAAKQTEVNNYVASKVFSALPAHLKPDLSQAMHMRWVLNYKGSDSGERKAKARCVILGYQDAQYELRATTSPTVSRTTRQIFLQCSANHGFKVYKGDVLEPFSKASSWSEMLSACR